MYNSKTSTTNISIFPLKLLWALWRQLNTNGLRWTQTCWIKGKLDELRNMETKQLSHWRKLLQRWTSMRPTCVDNGRLCSRLFMIRVRWSSASQPTNQPANQQLRRPGQSLSPASCGHRQKKREEATAFHGFVLIVPLFEIWGLSELLLSGEDQGKPLSNGAWSRLGC